MIQAFEPGGVHYAVRLLAGAAVGSRVARADQRAAAAKLLADVRQSAGLAAGKSSKSHSRALVAAALAPEGRVGIDVEFLDPRRDIGAVARYLMDADTADRGGAYRVFTFREAYFKAMGSWPAQALMRGVAAQTADEFCTADGVFVRQGIAAEVFALTLVWAPVDDELPRHAERHL